MNREKFLPGFFYATNSTFMSAKKLTSLRIGKVEIGEGLPVRTIAEVACQHGGDMALAKRLIEAAKEAGADFVKFQIHVPEAEMVPHSIRFWAGDMDEVLEKVNFEKAEQHAELKSHAEKVGIQYICTPFCVEAAQRLLEAGVDGFKVGSGELSNLPMLRFLARSGKPLILSTGMSTLEEIGWAVASIRDENPDVAFMLTHALSEYPPVNLNNERLGLIPQYKKEFGVMVGLSDHAIRSVDTIVSVAVALGAPLIEKHFTLPDIKGPDDVVSLTPREFSRMIAYIRDAETAIGGAHPERTRTPEEQVVADWAHHSVVTARAVQAREELTLENLVPKRPGKGIPSRYLDPLHPGLLGKRAARDLPADHILLWEEVEK